MLWLTVGQEDCVTLLLDRGADVNFRNSEVYEETALMRAAWLGEIKSVRVLLARGADPKLKSRFGDTTLDAAKNGCWGSSPEVIKLLKKATKKKK